jgi:T5SS/PEP-CTERM-associated repeat protein
VANSFTWFGGSGFFNVGTNWSPVGPPQAGDTAIENSGTILATDAELSSNTVFLNAGTIQFSNDTGSSFRGGSIVSGFDQGTTVFTGGNAAAAIDTFGNFVNDGLIEATGTADTNTTIVIAQDGTKPGYFLNYGVLEADFGNSLTIDVVGTSELFNAGLIYADGGTVVINGGTGIAGGYAPMLGGVAVVGSGGTLEFNAGFPLGTKGSSPVFAFYNGAPGTTLKLDHLGQFGGRILGFQQGDTIDLGGPLSVGTIAVTSDGQLLLEGSGGNVLATLVLSSGAYNTGTFAVSGGIADGFTLTTGGDGDTLLTTDVVDSVWNNSTGVWQNAADWAAGVVPGPTATAVIGYAKSGATGSISPFVLTTGSTAVNVDGLIEANNSATLQITSATTVGTGANLYGVQQIAGEIEVTGGNTLTSTFLRQLSPGADLLVDAGGVLDLIGHSDLGFANNGTLTETTVVNGTIITNGTTVVTSTTFANGDTIGLFVTGTATVDGGRIDDGPVLNGTSVVSTGGLTSIGQDGGGTPGSMTVENGATVIDTYGFLSSDPTSFGALTLTGVGTTWDDASDPTDAYNTRGYMIVGGNNVSGNGPLPPPAGTAQLVVENGATLNEATFADIGESTDSAGSATIASGGVWNIGTSSEGGFIDVGNSGSGTLDINGGTVNVLAGSTTASGGFPGAGTFTSNGTVVTNAAGVGTAHRVGSDGTVFVSGGGTLNITIAPTVTGSGFGTGQLGHGVLDIFSGGTVAIKGGGFSAGSDTTVVAAGTTVIGDGTIVVGGTFDANGTVESSGGPSSLLVSTGGAAIGKSGTGTLFVEAGGTVEVSGGSINVGQSAGSHGFVEINGGLVENSSNGLNVGNAGTGTLELLNFGTVHLIGGGIDVGESAGAHGLLEIASGGMLTSTSNGMDVGLNAGSVGTLEVLAGGIYNLSTHGISAGVSAGAIGSIVVDGSGALINLGSQTSGLDIGQTGSGYLTVENNGTVSDVGSSIDVGFGAGSTGTVVVASGGLVTTGGSSGIVVGNRGSGLLTVDAGGTVDDAGVFNVGVTGTGTLVVEGGTVDQTGVGFNVGGGGLGTRGVVLVTGGSVKVGGVDENAGGTITVGGGTAAAVLSSSGAFNIGQSLLGTVVATVDSLGTLTGTGNNFLDVNFFASLMVNGGLVTDFVNVVLGVSAAEGGDGGTLVVTGGGMLEGAAVTLNDHSLLQADSLTVGGAITNGEIGNLVINAGGTVVVPTITLTTGGLIDLNGGVLDPITIDVTGPGGIGGSGPLDANVAFAASGDSLTYSDAGGTLEIVGSITGAGTLVLATSSSILLDLAPDGAQSVTFGPGTETLILGAPAINTTAFAGMTIGFGDLIDLGNGVSITSVDYAAGTDGQNVTVHVTEGGSSGTIILDNVQFTGGATKFNITTDPSTNDAALQAACYAAGTRIATARGEIAVEDLLVGDMVATVLGEAAGLGEAAAPIIWLGRRDVDCAGHPKPRKVWPVRIAAGAFGPGQPHTELFLSPDHAVYVNEVLIPIQYLVNGSTISQMQVGQVTYYHLELPRHDVVLAQGLPAESFLDLKDGSNYSNRPGPVRLYPDFTVRMWEAYGCARLIVTGPELAAARALVAGFAGVQVAA